MASAVLVELKASSTEFMARMGEARHEVAKLGTESSGHFQKLQAVGKAAFLGVAGAAVAVGAVSLEMADKFEQANARLETAVANSGGSFEKLKPLIDAVNTQMGRFGYTSTETESALAGLTAATKNPTLALHEMGLAADIARGRNISLQDATNLLTKVQTGHVALLGRLGIAVKDASGHLISQREAMAKLAEMYGGAASRNAETFAGKTQALKAQMENLATKLGLALVPILEKVMSVTMSVVGWFERHKTTAEALAAVIGGVLTVVIGAWVAGVVAGAVEAVTAFTTMIASAVTWAATTIASAVSAAAAWLAAMAPILASAVATAAGVLIAFAPLILGLAAIGVAAYLLYSNWSTVWGAIKTAAEVVWSALKTVFDAVVRVGLMPIRVEIMAVETAWRLSWTAIKTAAEAVWHALKAVFDALIHAGLWQIKTEIAVLQAVWTTAWNAVSTVVSAVWSALKPVFDAVVHSGLSVIKREISGLQTVWAAMWSAIQTVVMDVWAVLKPIFDAIKSAVHDITGGIGKVVGAAGKIGHGIGHLIGFASGTDYAPGGMSLVGENGPELVNLPRGSQVIPNSRLGGGDVHVHFHGNVYGADEHTLAMAIRDRLLLVKQSTGSLGLA